MSEKFYWLTSETQSNMKTLKIKTADNSQERINADGEIWFEETEEDEAKMFLKDLKYCMHYLYCFKYGKAARATWMDNNWLNKFD